MISNANFHNKNKRWKSLSVEGCSLSLEIRLAEFCFSAPISLDGEKARFRGKNSAIRVQIALLRANQMETINDDFSMNLIKTKNLLNCTFLNSFYIPGMHCTW